MSFPQPPSWVIEQLKTGIVIPAHPLALDADRRFDEVYQRALSRYYHAAGSGGIAVAVHTTQFEIREEKIGLLQPVLDLASRTISECDEATDRKTVRVAGIVGRTDQAISEAELASSLGYHIGLLSLAAMKGASQEELIDHCTQVAQSIPIFGFYLQPAVGGIALDKEFWTAFSDIPNAIGIKIAPFNRYHTLSVIEGVLESSRRHQIALYTGNDDHIIEDLVSSYGLPESPGGTRLRIRGGLLGHWAVWTSKAVEHLNRCKTERERQTFSDGLRDLAAAVTVSNAALFDVRHNFRGCIAGLHYVLQKQGLLRAIHCLNPLETLSPGQAELIDAVYKRRPDLTDDDFVAERITDWLRP